jgi:PAS domain S-box-containing protein
MLQNVDRIDRLVRNVDAAARHLAAIVQSSDDAIASTTLDGVFDSWNPSAERLFGFSTDEAIGQHIRIIAFPEQLAEEEEILDRIRRGESVELLETIRRRRDGSLVEVALTVSPIRDPGGEIVGASRIARDIGDRRRMELQALRLAAIVNSSEDAIVSKDLRGRITSWNPAAERMFGYTADEAVGQSILLIIPEERRAEEDHVLSRIAQGLSVEHFQTVRRRKDGQLIDVSLAVSPIRDSTGRVVGASKIARDITEQRRLVRELEETSRLKDEFLATLSHELRTPLNAIMGYARMLSSGRIDEGRKGRALQLIDRNAQMLARLVSDVLDVSRIVAGKTRLQITRADLVAVLNGAVDVVRPAMDAKRLRFEWKPAVPTLAIMADADRLQQVFWNLLANAVKFTPEGGTVSVEVAAKGGDAVVAVRDTGMGIDPAFLPHLFERFRQADAGVGREFAGLGLGLAIVRHFVELHGGRVHAASAGKGHGATFTVALPLGFAERQASGVRDD